MRKLIVDRNKCFSGALVNYDVILNGDFYGYIDYRMAWWEQDNVLEAMRVAPPFQLGRYQIASGKTAVISIPEVACSLFVINGNSCSNELDIESGNEDIYCAVITKGGWSYPASCFLYHLPKSGIAIGGKALLVIDVQSAYMKGYSEDVLWRINQRISQVSENKGMIIYIKNTGLMTKNTISYEFDPRLLVCSPYIVWKKRPNAFSSISLMDILQKNKITDLEIIGVDGNYCVTETAIAARNYGYRVYLSCDFIGVKNRKKFEKKKNMLEALGILFNENRVQNIRRKSK